MNAQSIAHRGRSNWLKMISGHLATTLVALISGIVIPRFLGAEGYGQYAAVIAVLSILQTVSTLGLPQVEMRYLAPKWTSGQREEALDLASSLWFLRLFLSILAGMLAALWLWRSPGLAPGVRLCAVLGMLGALRCAFQATQSLLLPLGHVGKMSALDLLRTLLTLPVVVFAFSAGGLGAVFESLLALYVVLLLGGAALLLSIAPLRFGRLRWSSLRPHVSYSSSTFVVSVLTAFYSQFSIYAVATWASRPEAGILAVTVRFFTLARGLFLASRRALMPILAELEEQGREDKLQEWGELLMRYGVAAATVVTLGWTLLGGDLVRLLLTEDFAEVYPATTVIFVGTIFFCLGGTCLGLLFVRGRAGSAALATALYAALTGLGLLWVLLDGDEVVVRIAWVYALAAAAHAVIAHLALGWAAGLWLPLRRSLLLILPAAGAWPLAGSSLPFGARVGALLIVFALYAGWAVLLGLLPLSEIRRLFRGGFRGVAGT